MKTRTTPVSPTKTAALARVLAAVTHGYTRLCPGTVPPERLPSVAAKFDAKYGIAHTRAQRIVNKRAGRANTQLAVYSPPAQYLVANERLHWILLATPGSGLDEEKWQHAEDRPVWLDYELCRHNDAGVIRWTWRRPKGQMQELYAELGEDLARRRHSAVAQTLQRIAHQPGFHGIRTQSMALFDYAKARGYHGEFPHLFFVRKITHGNPLLIDTPSSTCATPTRETGP